MKRSKARRKPRMGKLRRNILVWLIKKLRGVEKTRSPVDVLWEMIDEERDRAISGNEADCIKVGAWEMAIDRIGRESIWAYER